ncbi:hypothetical protein CXR23_14485 [Brevibacterium aurantiacum]|uniref:Uncharacterized protein n=1 Tax=Brevibacterium aurantiacum TaxID=273384 RepID=A0A3T0DFX8_BREAU|nr:hypothetical protein CXR23_14485 [Brevibacterium aurantiacum]
MGRQFFVYIFQLILQIRLRRIFEHQRILLSEDTRSGSSTKRTGNRSPGAHRRDSGDIRCAQTQSNQTFDDEIRQCVCFHGDRIVDFPCFFLTDSLRQCSIVATPAVAVLFMLGRIANMIVSSS